MVEKDSLLVSFDTYIKEQIGQIESLNAEIAKRESLVETLNAKIADRDSCIHTLHQVIGERDCTISDLNEKSIERGESILELREEMVGLVGQLDTEKAAFSNLVNKLEERGRELGRLNFNSAALNRQILSFQHRLNESEARVLALQNSFSWRLTAPLRKAFDLLRGRPRINWRAFSGFGRSIKILMDIPAAVKRWGYLGLCKRVYQTLRTAGLKGVYQKGVDYKSFAISEDMGKAKIKRVQRTQIGPTVAQTPQPAKMDSLPAKKNKRILYIVNDHDLMTQVYRVHNYSQLLIDYGFESVIMKDGEIHVCSNYDADILVLNRICLSGNIPWLVEEFKRQERPVIFDVDDFVFDSNFLHLLCSYKGMGEEGRAGLENLFEGLEKTMMVADYVTTSTPELKNQVEKKGKKAFLLPNNNGLSSLEFARKKQHKHAASGTVSIAYMSGTNTHDTDFAQCCDALLRILRDHDNCELVLVGELTFPLSLKEFGARVKQLPLMSHEDMLEQLAEVDINLAPLELDNLFTDCKSELKIFEAAMFGIPTVASPTSSFSAIIDNGKTGYLAHTEEGWYESISVLVSDAELRASIGKAAKDIIASRYSIKTTIHEAAAIYDTVLKGTLRQNMKLPPWTYEEHEKPVVSIVSVVYRKSNEIRFFLESLRRQNIEKPYEVILVNDATTDDSIDVINEFNRWVKLCAAPNPYMEVTILENSENKGNCGSRNYGLSEAQGDVIIVVDADCMLNRSFLSEHYWAHMKEDCDVAIGPINIETNGEPPLSVLNRHEITSTLARNESVPQDPTNKDSFVNCITRNFSINRKFLNAGIKGDLFDTDFAYSADPKSGFGWEDVEMGYRVYQAGGRIKYLQETVSIHVSHPSSADEKEKPIRSLRNYRRLFEKHPDLVTASRQWSVNTYNAIISWAESVGHDLEKSEDKNVLDKQFKKYTQVPIIIHKDRKLKILTHRWHVPHQYELYKLGHEFTLVTGAGTGLCEQWEMAKRPMPENMQMVPVDQIDARDYDVAIMHFDENLIHPELGLGKVPMDWGQTFDWFMKNVDLPKVAICHGTPQFAGQYDPDYKRSDLGQILKSEREELVEYLSSVSVVCNSYQAQNEWQFHDSRTIWHGFSPHEYPKGRNDQGVLVMRKDALLNRPHYNGLYVMQTVWDMLEGKVELTNLDVPDPRFYSVGSQDWAVAKYQNYARSVGTHSIYLNPTLRSPMPRSRGEAMMAGLISVSMQNNDVDLFIKNGVNGFYADSAEELAEQILWLETHPIEAERIRKESLTTALDVFNQDRYLEEWSKLLLEIRK
ncbi:glycosyltransferase [Pseudodesulfovibrio sp. JC047]|nr:glycosyltransferase [Pseudodesulfovibrio sp. JC047]